LVGRSPCIRDQPFIGQKLPIADIRVALALP